MYMYICIKPKEYYYLRKSILSIKMDEFYDKI